MLVHSLCADGTTQMVVVRLCLFARHRRLVAVYSCPQLRASRQSLQCHTDYLLVRLTGSTRMCNQFSEEVK